MKWLLIRLGIVLLLALAAGGIAFVQRDNLREWQQSRHSRDVFATAEQAAHATKDQPYEPATLNSYADALVREGNLGRALYLTELYGAQQQDAAALRGEIEASIKAGAEQQFHGVSESAAGQIYKAEPLYQALLFLDGYRHALLGDWASAKNYFEAIQPRSLAPPLRPYAEYYLARSYRLAGTDEQKQQAEQMWLKFLPAKGGASLNEDLAAKARYNLIAYYLSESYEGADGEKRALAMLEESDEWPYQRALTELARFYADKGHVPAAWKHAQQSILAHGNSESQETALDTCLEVLSRPDFSQAWSADSPPQFDELVGEAMADAAQTPVQLHRVIAVLKAQRSMFKSAEIPAIRGLARAAALEPSIADVPDLRTAVATFGAMGKEAVLFNIAEAEAGAEQWNAALADYKACAELAGSKAGEAWYQCYHILKKVQEPLNLDSAETYLENAVQADSDTEEGGKALEELMPILTYRKHSSVAAQASIDELLGPSGPSVTAAYVRSQQMAQAWFAPKDNGNGNALRVWSYYEVLNNYPPRLDDLGQVPYEAPAATEYFYGLGLNDLAEETKLPTWGPDDLFSYGELRNREPIASQEVLAWHATEMLEEGQFASEAATRYALALAYPRPFDDILLPAARQFAIPPALVYAIIKKESGFKEEALSGQGAEGLMQVMPETAALVNSRYSLGIDLAQRTLPENNIRLGCANLRSLFDIYGNDNVRAVISAHNKGPGNYDKWRRQYPGADDILFTELIPNEENEQFTKLVWKYYMIYKWLEDSE